VSRRNLLHHACCSHVITTRGMLGMLVGSMQLTANSFSSLYATPLLPANYMGKQVRLTSITSIISMNMCIPHYASWQVHHMFICTSIMCSSACVSHSMHHNTSISMCTTPLCTRYSLCFGNHHMSHWCIAHLV
jgi:hypothetical protein